MTNRQKCIKYIKNNYPIGSEIWIQSAHEPYIVRKDSVFEAHIWGKEDYNPMFLPESKEDYNVDFVVHHPGNYTRRYFFLTKRIKDIINH